jgi:phosphoribosylanthranilate isomerase
MTTTPLIKICGIRTPADVEVCVQEQVAFAGLNLFPPSPRYVGWDGAKALRQEIHGPTKAVAVMVKPTVDEIARAVEELRMDVLQLHGVDAEYLPTFRPPAVPVWFAFGIGGPDDIKHLQHLTRVARSQNICVDGLLVDAKVEGLHGGSGALAPWLLLGRTTWEVPLVLAGGLTPHNVSHALTAVRPYAVDVASGVESKPGVKDPALIRAFVHAVRAFR